MCRPWSTRSSPTLTTAVTSAAGTTSTSPRRNRAAPTPPARTVITVTASPSPLRVGGGAEWSIRALLVLETGDVGVDHHAHELGKLDLRLPTERGPRLRGIADQQVDFGRTEELLVLHDILLIV